MNSPAMIISESEEYTDKKKPSDECHSEPETE